jgi:ATP-dependent DNA helicase RecQ
MDPRSMSLLRSTFAVDELRPGQAEACAAALDGRDLLVVMPTGAGKSLCYQLPALLTPGLTLVVSPLIALMRDQVAQLRARGVAAGLLHSGQAPGEAASVQQAARLGQLRLLYLSPERLVAGGGLVPVPAAALARVVVDEAHCVVRWGHDFRPDYQALAPALARLGEPPITALTATATTAEQSAILAALGRPRALRVVTGFDRPELFLSVQAARHAVGRDAAIAAACRRTEGARLIYAATRGETERLAAWLSEAHGVLAAPYHAGMAPAARAANQDAFFANRLPVIVATSAFGLGIDKSDVRAVVFAGLPPDISSFYQAIGRAGRDGRSALGLLVYSPNDRSLREWQIAASTPDCTHLAAVVTALARPAGPSTPLDEAELVQAGGLEPALVRATATLLGRSGILRRVAPGTWAALRAPRAGELSWLAEQAAAHAALRRTELDQVLAYAESRTCRRRRLLAHFGARPLRGGSACCDRCGGRFPSQASRRATLTSHGPTRGAVVNHPTLDTLALGCIGQRDGRLTLQAVSRAVREALGDAWRGPPDAIRAAIRRLIDSGQVAVHYGDGSARLALTRAGRLEARKLGVDAAEALEQGTSPAFGRRRTARRSAP